MKIVYQDEPTSVPYANLPDGAIYRCRRYGSSGPLYMKTSGAIDVKLDTGSVVLKEGPTDLVIPVNGHLVVDK